MNVVLYVRVSSQRQVEEGFSLEGQLQDLRKYCEQQSYTIVNEYIDEGNSAFRGHRRHVFQQMITEVTSGVFDVQGVVVYSLSRFARDLLMQLSSVKKLQDSGIRLISVAENLPEDRLGFKLTSVFTGLINEMNSEQNAMIVRSRLEQTAKQGYYTGGPIPFGYESITCQEDTKRKRKN
ncbi:recombinase family protein [Vibrio algarum]|uniref:Recombinase family protein n=1 Tax=Vibrio algarum TaxID=3020714 RepID=A0ABT4YPD1_9VIBR|nr:recombinase family protein [Vibrio sp. KJ40-1]MDB1123406.1 recombinase family protein [Vibrio sp. KJ40-1]